MSAALQLPMDLHAFLVWEERQQLRWEVDGVTPVAMTGGTTEHAIIQGNLYRALGNHLSGRPCRMFPSDTKVLAAGSIRYPDAFVACSAYPRGTTVIDDAVVVFEILSPSTAGVERVVKNQEYRATRSIQRYVMLEQDRVAATVFERAGDDWVGHLLIGESLLTMPEIGIELVLTEIHDGVVFPASEADGEA